MRYRVYDGVLVNQPDRDKPHWTDQFWHSTPLVAWEAEASFVREQWNAARTEENRLRGKLHDACAEVQKLLAEEDGPEE